MPFKINIGTKEGKTWKFETESEAFVGKELKQKVKGEEFNPDLAGYEFEISGASDRSGFTHMEDVDGAGRKRVLKTYGKGMKKRPKLEGKRKRSKNRPKGLRLRKTFRGKVLSEDTNQINLKLLKEGGKKLGEVFPDQAPQPEIPVEEPKTEEPLKEEAKTKAPEEKVEVKKEEALVEETKETRTEEKKE